MLSDIEEELRLEADALRAQLARERRAREHRLEINRLGAVTSGEVTREGVAEVLATGASAIFECMWVMVAFVDADDMVRIVHGPDAPDDVVEAWSAFPLATAVPIADMLRGDLDVCELISREQFDPWPLLVAEAERSGISSLVVAPVPGEERPAAAVALAWRDEHGLDDIERELIAELIATATPSFVRARSTEVDRDIASTLQTWLLPPHVPDVEHLDIATIYEAGREAQDVGGDWYDVVRLDDHRSTVVVGDVIGHDARAAAEMGQVRHVLAAHLLTTGDPTTSLELTDNYFHIRSLNTMATALVMVFDSTAGTIELASAGHLPPVIAESSASTRVLASGLGPPIGSGLGGYHTLTQQFPPDAVLIAFTDGVVELRNQTIDESVTDFCVAVDEAIRSRRADGSPSLTVDVIRDMIALRIADPHRTDDAAAVVCQTRRTDLSDRSRPIG